MEEICSEDGKLATKQVWRSRIDGLKAKSRPMRDAREESLEALGKALRAAVDERITIRSGLMLSGGLDSSLLALLVSKRAVKCYAVGFKDGNGAEPEDVALARELADQLSLDLKTKLLGLAEFEALLKRAARMLGPGLMNPVNAGVGAVEIACIELASKDNINCLMTGLGAEEVFAGYNRHRLALDVDAECWRGLYEMREKDLLREAAIASGTSMMLTAPFLDEGLMVEAMRTRPEFKINNKGSKVILRELAEQMGLPEAFAWRPKKAAQYGSRFDKAIQALSRKAGFGRKSGYLASLCN